MHMTRIPAIALMAIVSAGAAPVASRPAHDEALVAHYTFEEGPGGLVKDHSGNGNDGKNLGAKYVKLPDDKGHALRFDTDDAHVDCGEKPSLDLTDAVTIELWFRPETLVSKGEAGVVGKLMGAFSLSYSTKCWFYVNGGSNFCSTKPLGFSWRHIAATFDGKTVKLYCDGQLQGSAEAKDKKINHGENFYLRYPATYLKVEPTFKCMMDDVRVYRRALSEAEIVRHFRDEARATGRADVSGFDRVKLKMHEFPASATLVAQADFSRMTVLSPGAELRLELKLKGPAGAVVAKHRELLKIASSETENGERVARPEFSGAPMAGIVDWVVDVGGQKPGRYELRALVIAKDGSPAGVASGVDVTLPLAKPDWIVAYDDAKILNNLVAELLNVQSPADDAELTFSNPRNGWVFIASTASPRGRDKIVVTVDGDEGHTAIEHSAGTSPTLEAMRHLAAGPHRLRVRCDGAARPERIVVRAIPEIQIAGLGYSSCPWLKSYPRYDWGFLERIGLLKNVNVIVERNALPQNTDHVAAWVAAGRRIMTRFGMWPIWQKKDLTADDVFEAWTGNRGLSGPGYHGIIADEFSGVGHGGLGKYPLYSEAVTRIAGDPKYAGRPLYPYCMPMHSSQQSMDLLRAVIEGGSLWAEEKYLREEPTEEAARQYVHRRYVRNTLRYNETFPGAARHMIVVPGYLAAPPRP